MYRSAVVRENGQAVYFQKIAWVGWVYNCASPDITCCTEEDNREVKQSDLSKEVLSDHRVS